MHRHPVISALVLATVLALVGPVFVGPAPHAPPPKTPRQRSRRPPRRAATSPVWSISAVVVICTWSATVKAAPPSCSRPVTAPRPATGATISSTRTRRGRWSCPPWRSSPASAPTTARGPTRPSARTTSSAAVTPSPSPAPPRRSWPISTRCSRPQRSPVPMSWRPTRWVASSRGSTPAPTPTRSSASSSWTPISERLETLMTPEQWAALVRLNQGFGTDTVVPIPGYGDLETLRLGRGQRGRARGRRGVTAAADAPGRPRPRPAVRPAGGGAGVHVRRVGSDLAERRTRTWPPSSRTRASPWPARAATTSTRINPSW